MGCMSSQQIEPSKRISSASSKRKDGYLVIVHIRQARNIKKMDLISQSDTYIRVKIDDQEKKTSVYGSSKKPVWNTTFKFAGFDEKPNQVTLIAMDKDKFLSDEEIGGHIIDLKQYWDKDLPSWEWVPLIHKQNDQQENVGELQIKIEATHIDAQIKAATAHYDYTHVFSVEVIEGKQFKHTHGVECSLVEISFGNSHFNTQPEKGATPAWRRTVFFWATKEIQKNFDLKLSVQNKEKEVIGTALFPVSRFFDNEGKDIGEWLPIHPDRFVSDKDLADLAKIDKDAITGYVHINAKMIERDVIEKEFFSRLLKEFDSDKDGILSREEVAGMIASLGVEMSHDQFNDFWDSVDLDQSEEVSEDEAILMLRLLLFSSAENANRLLHFLTYGIEAISSELMKSVPADQNDSEIKVMDREHGIIVKENIPHYIKVAMKTSFSNRAGRGVVTSKRVVDFMIAMSKKQGLKFDDTKSIAEIPPFIELHHLNVDEIEKPFNEYKTFNEFFSRALKPSARPIDSPNDPNIALCPADCRMMVFSNIQDSTKFWIKGDEFTVENLLGPAFKDLAPNYSNGAFVIARLAPQDYHRFHVPVNGRLGAKRTPIPGSLFTVNPIAINQNVNVYTTNKREIVELDSPEFGKVIIVAVGAAMVGTIHFVAPDNSEVKRGDTHGFFSFGGSTVLLLFEPGRIEFNKDLLENSSKKIETLVRVNSSLGKALKKH